METILTAESIVRYQQWLYGKGLSDNTIKWYSTDVRMFFQELELSSCQVTDLATMAAMWLTTSKRTHKPKTVRRRMTSIRMYARMAGLPNLLPDFKLPSPGQSHPHPLPGLLDDLNNLVGLCRTNEQRCLVALLGFEGLRLGEVLDFKLDWINLHDKTITVYGKGDKERVLPITTRADEHIIHRFIEVKLAKQEYLVTYSDRGARNFITNLGVTAAIKRPISSHDLRATFATLAYASSKDPAAVQALLGHSSYDTTKVYVQIAMEAMRLAAEF